MIATHITYEYINSYVKKKSKIELASFLAYDFFETWYTKTPKTAIPAMDNAKYSW